VREPRGCQGAFYAYGSIQISLPSPQTAPPRGEQSVIFTLSVAAVDAPIIASATLYASSYPPARCGGLRGAGSMSTDAKMAANIE